MKCIASSRICVCVFVCMIIERHRACTSSCCYCFYYCVRTFGWMNFRTVDNWPAHKNEVAHIRSVCIFSEISNILTCELIAQIMARLKRTFFASLCWPMGILCRSNTCCIWRMSRRDMCRVNCTKDLSRARIERTYLNARAI